MIDKKDLHSDKYIATGYLITGSSTGKLTSSPLGSCVAVIAYDKTKKAGGLAHIMLPGKSSKGNDYKYAEDAITQLIDEIIGLGAVKTNIEICLVGGANVLNRKNDNIGDNLIINIYEILKKENLIIKEKSLAGVERRSASIDLSSGLVSYTIGDSKLKKLYQFIAKEKIGDNR